MNENKIGNLRAALLRPYNCAWNGAVRDVTAAIEGSLGFKLLPVSALVPIVRKMVQEQLTLREGDDYLTCDTSTQKSKAEYDREERCPNCKRVGAVMYNQWNGVFQCHYCGRIVEVVYDEPPYLRHMQDGLPLPSGYVRHVKPLK